MSKEDSHPPTIDDKDRAEQAFDNEYNRGVDDCLRIARMGADHADLVDDRSALSILNAIIAKFQSLKK